MKKEGTTTKEQLNKPPEKQESRLDLATFISFSKKATAYILRPSQITSKVNMQLWP